MLSCGDCFLAGHEDDDKLHLRIVATPPTADGCFIAVSVTSLRRNSETLVTLRAGDHPFIQHDSVIAYRYSEICWVASIEAAIASGTARLREPLDPQHLAKIQAGLRDSDFTPNGVRHFAREVLP
jgi:hypothetical protein